MPANISSDADAYRQQLIALAPTGDAWSTEAESTWYKLLDALAQEFARVDAHVGLLVDESFPDSTLLLLPNWERVAGLPDDCSLPADTIQIRKQNLMAKLVARGGATKAYLIEIAQKFGFNISIVEYNTFRVDYSAVESPLNEEEWKFTFTVEAPSETITWFRAGGSAAGEPLATWGNERLECLITKLKPAHTRALFAYSDSF